MAVDERFQYASTGSSEEQERLNGIIHAEQERLTKTQTGIEQMLEKLKTDVNTAVEKMAAVGDGKLDDIATALIEQQGTMEAYKADQAKNIDVIHKVMRNEVSLMHGDVKVLNITLQGRMAAVEHVVQQQMMNTPVGDSRQAPGGARGYQIRVPYQTSWNLTVLKNGETGFLPWRKSFELQVRAAWAGLDVVLEALREETSPVGREVYDRLVQPHIPEGASPMDWDYTHISNTCTVCCMHVWMPIQSRLSRNHPRDAALKPTDFSVVLTTGTPQKLTSHC